MKSSPVEDVGWRQNYSLGITRRYHIIHYVIFKNVNIVFARGNFLFWSPSRWIFSNGGKTNMSCFYELFAKRLLNFCKYFFFNDIFLSFIDLMSIVSLKNMLCRLNNCCVKLPMFCIFSNKTSPRHFRFYISAFN